MASSSRFAPGWESTSAPGRESMADPAAADRACSATRSKLICAPANAPAAAAEPAIEHAFVQANGLRFHVAQCGEGDRLALCLHGFPELWISWRHQLPLLARLGWRAWAPDLRGYGESERPRGVESYAIERLMDDVAGLIAPVLDWDEAAVQREIDNYAARVAAERDSQGAADDRTADARRLGAPDVRVGIADA